MAVVVLGAVLVACGSAAPPKAIAPPAPAAIPDSSTYPVTITNCGRDYTFGQAHPDFVISTWGGGFNHLDIRARFELLDLIRATGVTTLAVLHDIDLAARSCNQLVVLQHGQVAAAGPVLDALTPQILRAVFGVNAIAQAHPDGVIRVHYSATPLADPGSGR